MDSKIADALDLIQTKFEENKITPAEYGSVVVTYFDKCTNIDDVSSLIGYLIRDESGSGIKLAKDVAEKALLQKQSNGYGLVYRGVETISATSEMLLLAECFAGYSKPQDRDTFLKIYKLALDADKEAFDYHLLAMKLVDACKNIEDPTIDSDFELTKNLIKKAADLYVDGSVESGVNDLLYMAKITLKDKDLVKYLTAIKKKLKK